MGSGGTSAASTTGNADTDLQARAEAAKAVCGRCTVRANCLSYALETMPEGIWGGTTQEERCAARRSSGRRVGGQSRGRVNAAMTGEPAVRAGHAAGQRVTSGWIADELAGRRGGCGAAARGAPVMITLLDRFADDEIPVPDGSSVTELRAFHAAWRSELMA